MDTQTLIILASLSMCPAFLIVGLALGAILMFQFTSKRNRRWHYMTVIGVRGRDMEMTARQYLEDGWAMHATPNEAMAGYVDLHFNKFM